MLTRSGIKMLHEMQPGETGSLVVSTPILARYRIGDIILALRPPYFRCIGREQVVDPADYWWNELTSLNFGRLSTGLPRRTGFLFLPATDRGSVGVHREHYGVPQSSRRTPTLPGAPFLEGTLRPLGTSPVGGESPSP